VSLGKAWAIAITKTEKIMEINTLELLPRSLTWKGSVVRSHYRPPVFAASQLRLASQFLGTHEAVKAARRSLWRRRAAGTLYLNGYFGADPRRRPNPRKTK